MNTWKNKKTGTIYTEVEFNGTGVAVVTTDAGSRYTVRETLLEPVNASDQTDEPNNIPVTSALPGQPDIRQQLEANVLKYGNDFAEYIRGTHSKPNVQATVDNLLALISQTVSSQQTELIERLLEESTINVETNEEYVLVEVLEAESKRLLGSDV